MWFLIRLGEGVVYYVLAVIIRAFGDIALAPYGGQYGQHLPYLVSGAALVALLIILTSRTLTRRYLG